MPAPKGPYARARYNQVPEHTEPLRVSAGCDGPSGRRKLLLRQLIGGTANHAD